MLVLWFGDVARKNFYSFSGVPKAPTNEYFFIFILPSLKLLCWVFNRCKSSFVVYKYTKKTYTYFSLINIVNLWYIRFFIQTS